MQILRTLVASTTLLAAAGACAPAGIGPATGPQPREEKAIVRVTNHNWADVVVYAVRYSTRYRLGMLATNQTLEFRLPSGAMSGSGDLRLLVDPIGSREVFTTQSISVAPGQWVDFKIENHLAISNWAVWNRRGEP
jgi:hypothetical protein